MACSVRCWGALHDGSTGSRVFQSATASRQADHQRDPPAGSTGETAGPGVDRQRDPPAGITGETAGPGVSHQRDPLAGSTGETVGLGVSHKSDPPAGSTGETVGPGVSHQRDPPRGITEQQDKPTISLLIKSFLPTVTVIQHHFALPTQRYRSRAFAAVGPAVQQSVDVTSCSPGPRQQTRRSGVR